MPASLQQAVHTWIAEISRSFDNQILEKIPYATATFVGRESPPPAHQSTIMLQRYSRNISQNVLTPRSRSPGQRAHSESADSTRRIPLDGEFQRGRVETARLRSKSPGHRGSRRGVERRRHKCGTYGAREGPGPGARPAAGPQAPRKLGYRRKRSAGRISIERQGHTMFLVFALERARPNCAPREPRNTRAGELLSPPIFRWRVPIRLA